MVRDKIREIIRQHNGTEVLLEILVKRKDEVKLQLIIIDCLRYLAQGDKRTKEVILKRGGTKLLLDNLNRTDLKLLLDNLNTTDLNAEKKTLFLTTRLLKGNS